MIEEDELELFASGEFEDGEGSRVALENPSFGDVVSSLDPGGSVRMTMTLDLREDFLDVRTELGQERTLSSSIEDLIQVICFPASRADVSSSRQEIDSGSRSVVVLFFGV